MDDLNKKIDNYADDLRRRQEIVRNVPSKDIFGIEMKDNRDNIGQLYSTIAKESWDPAKNIQE